MPDGSKGNVKLVTDDTSVSSIVKNKNDSAKDLIHDFFSSQNGRFCGKCCLTQTLLNLHKK